MLTSGGIKLQALLQIHCWRCWDSIALLHPQVAAHMALLWFSACFNTADTRLYSVVAMLLPIKLVAVASDCSIFMCVQVIVYLLLWPCINEIAR